MALNNRAGPIIAEIPEIKCLVDLLRKYNINCQKKKNTL